MAEGGWTLVKARPICGLRPQTAVLDDIHERLTQKLSTNKQPSHNNSKPLHNLSYSQTFCPSPNVMHMEIRIPMCANC